MTIMQDSRLFWSILLWATSILSRNVPTYSRFWSMVQYYGPSIYLSKILPTYLQFSLHKIHVCISFPYIIIYIHPMITIRCAWLHCIIIIYAVHVDVSGFFSPSSLTPTIALERVTRITRVARVHRIEAGTTGHLRTPRHSSERWL